MFSVKLTWKRRFRTSKKMVWIAEATNMALKPRRNPLMKKLQRSDLESSNFINKSCNPEKTIVRRKYQDWIIRARSFSHKKPCI